MPQIIKNVTQLRRWLKADSGATKFIHAKFVDEETLVISETNQLQDEYVVGFEWPISAELDCLRLPELKDVKSWWKTLLKGGEWEHRISDEVGYRMCCMCRKANWDSLPNLFTARSKSDFKLVSAARFLRTVGPELEREMGLETFFLGISIRRIKKKPDHLDKKLVRILKQRQKTKGKIVRC